MAFADTNLSWGAPLTDGFDEAVVTALGAAEGTLQELAGLFLPFPLLADGRAARETLPDMGSRYRVLVEQIPAIVFMAFLDQGLSESYVSPHIETMLGFTQAEWLNDPVRWFGQLHPDDKIRWSVEAAQLFLTGEPLKSVYRVLARDGRVVWFHAEAKMVRCADGRPWFIHGVAFDISELKQAETELKRANAELRREIQERQRAERALSRSEEMFRGIFEYAPDTILVVDARGRVGRINAQVTRMFGYTPDEVRGRHVELLLPETLQQIHRHHRETYVRAPHLRPMGLGLELYGRRKDGAEFPVEIMLSPVEGAPERLVIAVVRDITSRKQADAAMREYAERLRTLSRRLMEVQEAERRRIALELHDEVGQALTGLKLTLEMMSRLPVERRDESLARAQAVVNELMGRVRKMSLDLRPGMLDDLGLLPALLWHIEQYGAQTHIRVDFRHRGLEGRRFLPEIETASYRIVQEALTNVARHAGVPHVHVVVIAEGAALTIRVTDRGQGFPADEMGSVKLSSGLAGMRERALLLGGDLRVESRPGWGTRLTAELPLP